MAEVASAFVSLVPSAKGFGSKTSSLIDPELSKAGKSGGSKLSGALGGFLKKSAIGIGVAAGGILGTALFSGFKRLDAIDQAKAKLDGLGISAKTSATIMDNALTSVKGTAFGLGDAATIAASAVAAGIKPGQELTKYLKLTADAASITGDSLSDMGRSLNNVQTLGAAYNDTLQSFSQKGIPVYSLLSKKLDISAGAVKKLASEGKISAKVFNSVLSGAVGGAAKKAGNTFTGAFANMKAALGRFGASLLTGIFPIVKQVFGGLTGLLDKATKAVGPFADALAAKIPGALEAIGAAVGPVFQSITSKIPAAIAAVKGLFASASGSGALSAAFDSIKGTVSNLVSGFMLLVPPVKAVFAAFAPTALVIVKAAFAALLATASGLASVFSSVLAPALAATLGWIANNAGPVLAFVGVLAAFKTAVVVISTATKLWAAAQLLLDAALTANPIGLVVVAVAALAAGLVYAYQHSETFRNIVNAAFTVIKTVVIGSVTAVVGFVKAHWPLLLAIIAGPLGVAVGLVIRHWAQIKAATVAAWNAVKAVTSAVWNGLKAVVSGAVGGIKAAVSAGFGAVKALVTGYWNGVRAVTSAAWGAIKAVVSAAAHGISAVVSGAMGAVRGAVSAAFNAARAIVSGAMNAIKGAVAGGISAVLGLFGGLLGRIRGALAGAAGVLAGVGRAIIQGLIGGIQSAAGAVASAAANVVKGAISAAKGALGIHSPSKVFHAIGVNTGKGFVNGVKSQAKAAADAVKNTMTAAQKEAANAQKLAVLQARQSVRDINRELSALTGKKGNLHLALTGLDRAEKQSELVAAKYALADVRRPAAAPSGTSPADIAKAVKAAFAAFSLSNVLPQAADPNVITVAMKAALADLKKQVTDAGGKVTKTFGALSSALVNGALSLDHETQARDKLKTVLDDQVSTFAALTQTMQTYSDSVASNFLSNGFGAPTTTSTPGVANPADQAALNAAQAQLGALRNSAGGDSVAAAAAASKLIPQIKTLQDSIAAQQQPIETTVSGLDMLKKTLADDTAGALAMSSALATLKAEGLNPELFAQVGASGNFATAGQIASLSPAEIAQLNTLFTTRAAAVTQLATQQTQAVYGQQQKVLQGQVDTTNSLITHANSAIAAQTGVLTTLGDRVEAGANRALAPVAPAIMKAQSTADSAQKTANEALAAAYAAQASAAQSYARTGTGKGRT